MTSKITSSKNKPRLTRLVAEERMLLQEKAALETMLKNVQALRHKLKIEQIQLSGHLQAELGDQYVEVPIKALSPDPLNIAEEEASITVNKPVLNLDINRFNSMFFGADDFGEDDDEDSEDEIGCAKEVLGNQSESELNFEDF